MLKKITPNIMVKDVNKTIEFYKEVLGFELINTVPESGEYEWAQVKLGKVELMFQTQASLVKGIAGFEGVSPFATIVFYIEVEGLQVLYDRIKQKVKIVDDIHETFYGMKEFCIEDCNGYFLTFAGIIPMS